MIQYIDKIMNKLNQIFDIFKEFIIELRNAIFGGLPNYSSLIQILAFILILIALYFLVVFTIYIFRVAIIIKLQMNRQIAYEPYNKRYKLKALKKYQKRVTLRSKDTDKKGFKLFLLLVGRFFRSILDLFVFAVLHSLNLFMKFNNAFRVRCNNSFTKEEREQLKHKQKEVKVITKKEKQQEKKINEPEKVNNEEFTRLITNYAKLLKENEDLKLNNLTSLTKQKDDEINALKNELAQYRSSFDMLEEKTNSNTIKSNQELFTFILNVINKGDLASIRPSLKPIFDKYNLELIDPNNEDHFSERLMIKDGIEPTQNKKLVGQIFKVNTIGMYNIDTLEVYQKSGVVLYEYAEEVVEEEIIEEEAIEFDDIEEEIIQEPEEKQDTEENQEEQEEIIEEDIELNDIEDETIPETEEQPEEEIDSEPEIIEEEPLVEESLETEEIIEIHIPEEEINTDDETSHIEEKKSDSEEAEITEEQEDLEDTEHLKFKDDPVLKSLIEEVTSNEEDHVQNEETNEEEPVIEIITEEEAIEPEENEEVEDLIQQELNKWMNEN